MTGEGDGSLICTTGITGDQVGREAVLASLTDREAEIVRAVVAGLGPAEMSEDMGISESTARSYVFRICQGLHLRGLRELTMWGMQNPEAIVVDAEMRKAGRCGLHPKSCSCGSPYCSMRMKWSGKKAA